MSEKTHDKILKLPAELKSDNEDEIYKIIFDILAAKKGDDLVLMCGGYGGDVLYACSIINAIIQSNANVYSLVDSECDSASADVALNSHLAGVFIAPIGVHFTIHDARLGMNGVPDTLHKQSKFYRQFFIQYAKDIGLMSLLTKKEQKQYFTGQDLTIDGPDMINRLKLREDNPERGYSPGGEKIKEKD